MPPVRTMPAKPMKTERTHEENQERAYIAASRRSDRSLEARIESARRASEIHKRRTGRSLRVTEADVINEEMYEEEDDDLPMQYRRLTAHLQTQNADFDRRLAAYLTNHVAMRSALGQAVSDAWQNNQFNNIGQFMNPNMMQMPQQQQQQQQPQHPHAFQNPMMPPQQQTPNRSPTSYRQSPYPVPNASGMRPGQHGRSVSVATPQNASHQQKDSQSAQNSPVDNLKLEDRRMSLPVQNQNMMPPTPKSHAPSSNHSSPALSRSGSATNLTHQAFHPQQQPTPPVRPSSRQPHPTFQSPFPQSMNNMMNFDPMTSTLPMESQQLLAGAPFDLNMQAMFMPPQQPTNNSKASQPFYSYNPNGNGKAKGTSSPQNQPSMPQPPMLGMNQTLAPSMLDTNSAYMNSPANDSVISPYTPAIGYGYGFNDAFTMDPLKELSSGQITPGDNDWQGLLNDSWDDATAA